MDGLKSSVKKQEMDGLKSSVKLMRSDRQLAGFVGSMMHVVSPGHLRGNRSCCFYTLFGPRVAGGAFTKPTNFIPVVFSGLLIGT